MNPDPSSGKRPELRNPSEKHGVQGRRGQGFPQRRLNAKDGTEKSSPEAEEMTFFLRRSFRICICVAAAAALAASGCSRSGNGGEASGWRFARLERGDVVQTVRATGTIQPLRLVQVGTQVNGPVKKLYVDFNDKVRQGDLVAQIDPTVYEARLAQDQANMAQASASVEQTRAKLRQAQRDLERAVALASRDMISQAELDAARAAAETLEAQLKLAEASVEQARAALRLSQANLDYTTIRSPVDGVVVSRNVSEGQTVVASMSAQVLFLIATDLSEIQVEANVPEADIGKIRPGQPVAFTVDAYDETFTGAVSEVRLSASSVQNVVTYPVIIRAPNPDTKLFPGMTANVVCEVAKRTGVLKVPNPALRFRPENANAEKEFRHGSTLWIQERKGAPLKPVRISSGISDGSFTEITDAGGLREGDSVVVGKAVAGPSSSEVVNPFAPPRPPGMRPPR